MRRGHRVGDDVARARVVGLVSIFIVGSVVMAVKPGSCDNIDGDYIRSVGPDWVNATGDHFGFVVRDGTKLRIEAEGGPGSIGKEYKYLGVNYWYGANVASKGPGGDRQRLERELDNLAEMGVTNLRVMAASEGPDSEPYRMVPAMQISPGVYNEDVLDGLDYLLHEMRKRGMRAVMCLGNFWAWSGGKAPGRAHQ